MVITVEFELSHTSGKFVAAQELVEELENAIGGEIDVEDSTYSIDSVSVHTCPKAIPATRPVAGPA